ncbi:cyclopropane-fatty-acyl-phospholipid synthase [Tanacetum coccineum]
MFLRAGVASAKYFYHHISRQNFLPQASKHAETYFATMICNDLFALFLDDTMTYSCAVFKSEDEDLKSAQMRKITSLIEKPRVKKNHRVLGIGCDWGTLAIELVQRTGCSYTGITLSEEQLKYAENKVKEAGLQDQIRFLLCASARDLQIRQNGYEYMEEFFGCFESILADDGLFVLQFISIPDQRYDEYRRSSDFIKEYIFPGGCLPSLSRVTSAMAASSRLCVEHVENIGIHYYQTLRYQRTKTKVVFSSPGNSAALQDPYEGFPRLIL